MKLSYKKRIDLHLAVDEYLYYLADAEQWARCCGLEPKDIIEVHTRQFLEKFFQTLGILSPANAADAAKQVK